MDYQEEYNEYYKQFAAKYDLDGMDSANDGINLEMYINNAISIRRLQQQIRQLAETDAVGNVIEIKKLSDIVRDTQATNVTLERQLGIDRKTRQLDGEVSTAEYINHLKKTASEFLENRIIKVYCPDCNVMVGRLAPVHEHTAYDAAFECSQCKRYVIIRREGKDVLFDVKPQDRDWRRKYPVEIAQPIKRENLAEDYLNEVDPEIVIDFESGEE